VQKTVKQKRKLRAQGQFANTVQLLQPNEEEKKEVEEKPEKKLRDSSQTSTQSAPSQTIKPIVLKAPVLHKEQRLTP